MRTLTLSKRYHTIGQTIKKEGYWVRDMDIKMHEYVESASDEFVKGVLHLIGVILRVIFYLNINKHTFIII